MSRNLDIINDDFYNSVDIKLYELEVLHFNYMKEMKRQMEFCLKIILLKYMIYSY